MTETVCPYCGVGCMLELHVQDNSIVKVTSPLDHSVTAGHLCVKGRFGFQFVQRRRAMKKKGRATRPGPSVDLARIQLVAAASDSAASG